MKMEGQGTTIWQAPEERGIGPHILQAGSIDQFLQKRPGHPMHKEAGEGSLSIAQWEGQWQEFLRTLDNPHSGCGIPHFPEKPSPWEDAKAFLASFEQVADACKWPQEEWATRLLPALSGEAEKAFERLDVRDRVDYGKAKAAILRGDALSREKQREEFRRFCYKEAEGPRGAYSRLREMCRGWLRVENHSKEQILELLILEQLLNVLPPEIQSHVRECGPETCFHAVVLADEFLLRQREAEREEKQVPVEEVAGRVSEASQGPSQSEQTQLLTGIKEEEDGETSMLGEDEDNEELHQTLSDKPKREDFQGNIRNQGGPRRQKESHKVEKMDQRIPGQAEDFQEEIHKAEETYKCLECAINFTDQRQYNMHLQMHAGKKTHKCSACGKSFIHRAELLRHQRTHTGEKPFQCSVCGKKLTRNSSLQKHQITHTGEKLFECSECGKKFNCNDKLQQHKRTHTRKKHFECSECGNKFSQRFNLQRHQRTHTGEKHFQCSVCGKKFTRNSSLQQHKRTHTGENILNA